MCLNSGLNYHAQVPTSKMRFDVKQNEILSIISIHSIFFYFLIFTIKKFSFQFSIYWNKYSQAYEFL